MLDFKKSTVADVLSKKVYDKVTIMSCDHITIFEGDAFDDVPESLLPAHVAELVDGYDKSGYECAEIRLCESKYMLDSKPSYDDLVKKVRQLENELAMTHEESDCFERWYHEEQDAYYSVRQDEDMALSLLKFALIKKANGHKVKLRKVANDVALALGYGDGFFDE